MVVKGRWRKKLSFPPVSLCFDALGFPCFLFLSVIDVVLFQIHPR